MSEESSHATPGEPTKADITAPNLEPAAAGESGVVEKAEADPKAKPRQPRRWRRRLTLSALVVIALAIVLRMVLWALLPTVLARVAGYYDLNLNYQRLDFSAVDGVVSIWNPVLSPRAGGEPVAAMEYIHGQINVFSLLRGKLDVWRVEVDGVDLNIERKADGRVPLLERFIASSNKAKPPAAANGRIDLTPPLVVDAFRLGHVRAHLRDASVSPPLDSMVELDMRVSDVGSATRATRFEIDLSSTPVLDDLRVEGQGRASGAALDADVRVTVRGLHAKPALGYLAPLGLRPVADSLDMKMTGRVRTGPAGQFAAGQPATGPAGISVAGSSAMPAEALAAHLELENLQVSADGQESASVQRVTIDANKLAPGLVELGTVHVDGVRCSAVRGGDGHLLAAGFALFPLPATPEAPSAPVAAPQPGPPSPAVVAAFKWSIGELAIRDVQATFDDVAVAPHASLAFVVDQFTVDNVVDDPARPDAQLKLSGRFHAPGIARGIAIDGVARPLAARRTLDLHVRADGVNADALQPYLDLVGVESQLKDATFVCDLQAAASVTPTGLSGGDAHLTKLSFSDGDELLAMNDVHLAGVRVDSAKNLYHVDTVEIAGPALSARREASGALSAIGLRTRGFPGHPTPARAERSEPIPSATPLPRPRVAGPGTRPTVALLPRVEVGKLVWTDVKVKFDDLAVSPSSPITLSDAGLELADLRFDFDSTHPGEPGRFKAWLAVPTVADRLAVEGAVTPRPNSLAVDMTITGKGLSGAILAPYFKGEGIESVLRDGSLDLHAKIDLTRTDEGFVVSTDVRNIRYASEGRELAGVDALHVEKLALTEHGVSVDDIEIDRPRASAARDADGSLLVGGMRILPAGSGAMTKPVTVTPPVVTVVVRSTQPSVATTAPAEQAASPLAVVLKKLRVQEGALSWTDRAVQPAVVTTAGFSLELDHFSSAEKAAPGVLRLTAKADGSLDELTVDGPIFASATGAGATLAISASGLRAGPLASYLPSGTAINLMDGRLHVNLDATAAMEPAGGFSGHLLADHFDYRDGEKSSPLLAFDSAAVRVARADLPDNALAVDEVSIAGLSGSAQKGPDGSLRLLGLTSGAPLPPTGSIPATQPVTLPTSLPAAQPEPVGLSAQALIARSHKPLPLITLDKLDINVQRFSFEDLSRPGSVPVAVSELHLKNLNRVECLGPRPAARPPTRFELTCKVDPVIDALKITTAIAPFAEQPTLQVDIAADGVRGDGITALIPEMKEQVDGSRLKDGHFSAKLEAQARLDRRSPIDFDVSHGFELGFDLSGVEFRSEAGGPVVAGISELRTEGARIRPASGAVQIHTLEINKPTLRAVRDKDGIRALGMLVKMPAQAVPATGPAIQSLHSPAADRKPESGGLGVKGSQPAPKPAAEMRVDKVTISGLDVTLEDRSVSPPLLVPLNGLEVEVVGLSNMDLYENRPIRFDAVMNAGKVPLPRRGPRSAGMPVTEDRDLLAQAAASGRLTLYPEIKGWTKASVSGLELAALQGEAKAAGFNLSAGTFDSDVDARFQGTGSMDARTRIIFTDLSVSEPAHGPITSFFNFPAPLDMVIGTMEAADGSITLPIDVPVSKGKLSVAGVEGSAIGAVTGVVATAVTSAPIKAVAGVGSLLGGEKKKEPEKPVVLVFPQGSAALETAADSAIARIIQRLLADPSLEVAMKQELGDGDVTRAAIRANPSRADCQALAYRLHERKLELQRMRGDVGGQARGQMAARDDVAASATIARLGALDRELAQTESALDKVYDLLRPGADRQADRRTRAASLELARDRLETVRAALLASGIPGINKRLEKLPAAQFNPEGPAGGSVTITLVPVKK